MDFTSMDEGPPKYTESGNVCGPLLKTIVK